jgi:uroporphyrin-3 C-methyltransferase
MTEKTTNDTQQDTQQEQALTETPQPSPAAAAGSATQKQQSLPLILSIVALIAVLGMLVAAYFIWHEVNRQAGWQREVLAQIDTRNQAMDARVQTLGDRLEADLAAARQRRDALRLEQEQLASDQAAIEGALGLLRSQVGRSQDEWVLAEARYLLHVANQRLQLQHDVATALAALNAADQRLLSLGDASYIPVRQAIAEEIATLRAVPVVDRDGLALELQQLAMGVDQLRVQGTQYTPEKPADVTGDNDSWRAKSWREIPGALWTALKELVVVRRNDQPVGPMLPPDAQFFLYANLKLQLDAARLALLAEEPAAWRASLDSARNMLGQYFDPEDVRSQRYQEALERLAAVEVRPDLPDISGSLQTLRQEMALAGMDEAAATPADQTAAEQDEAPATAAGDAESNP